MWKQLSIAYNIYAIYNRINKLVNNKADVSIDELQNIKQRILSGGCITIKFAQWIISRLRSEKHKNIVILVNYFDDIFEDCPTHSLEYTLKLYKSDWAHTDDLLHKNLNDYIYIDSLKVIASGSVGQIYYAKLKTPYILCQNCDKYTSKQIKKEELYDNIDNSDNEWINTCPHCESLNLKEVSEVAIKVKHPNINKDIETTQSLFYWLSWFQKNKWLKTRLHLHMNFNDFIDNMNKQIDFRQEQYNNRKFRNNFRGNNCIYFPMIFDSSYNMIISEYVKGVDMDTISEFNQYKTCLNFACFVTKMVVNDNFIHGDLHHKNWKVRMLDDNKPQIIVFDCGICFHSDDSSFGIKLWEAFENNDIQVIIDNIDYIIDGDYSSDVKEYIINTLKKYINDSYDLISILTEFNTLLSVYNCRLTSLILNIILLLCVIDATLKKHNIIGDINTEIIGDTKKTDILELKKQQKKYQHYNIIKSKMMDLLSFIDSRDSYPDTKLYLEEKKKRYNIYIENKELFFSSDYNNLELDFPE